MFRRSAAVVVALAVTLGATACQPEPTPTPTGPAFASEDEAFAAAEETYRAYVDALNQVDLSDPETFEAVYAWTTGDFRASEKKTLSEMHAESWSVSGESIVARIDKLPITSNYSSSLSLGACVDVSSVTLVDSDGVSQVSQDRPLVQMTQVDLVGSSASPTGYLISDIAGTELEPPCQP